MAKFKHVQNTFSQGMLSPKINGRTELAEFFQGAEKIVNYLGYKQGGLYQRPGTIFDMDLKTVPGVDGVKDLSDATCFITYGLNQTLISSANGTYLLSTQSPNYSKIEIGKEYDGTDIQVFSTDEIFDYVQVGEILFITRLGKFPLVLYRYINANGTSTETGYKLQLATTPIDQNAKAVYDPTTTHDKKETLLQPFRAPNIVSGKTAKVTATTGAVTIQFNFRIVLAFGCLVKFSHGAVTGVAKITGTAVSPGGSTHYNAQVLVNFSNTTTSDDWQVSEWGLTDFSSFPTNIAVFEQRLIYGRKENIFGSTTGALQNFMLRRLKQDVTTDTSGLKYFGDTKVTDPIDFIIASKQQQYVKWMQGGEVLEVGTNNGEYSVSGTQGQILATNNVSIQEQSNFGGGKCKALRAGKETLFISEDRRNIRTFLRSGNTTTYDTQEIMALSEDIFLGETFRAMYYQNDTNVIYFLTEQNTVKAMTLNRAFGVRAFSEIQIDGDVERVCVMAGKLYFILRRGTKVSMSHIDLEFRGLDHTGDDFTYMEQSVNFDQVASMIVSGLDHLDGETIDVIGDGVLYEALVVTSGSVTVPVAVSKGVAGLRYSSYIETFNLEAGGSFGTAQGEKKRISEVHVKFYRSHKARIGPSLTQNDPIKGKEFNFQVSPSTIPLETLNINHQIGITPSFENKLVVGQFQSLPSNILALVYKGVTYDE